MCTQIHVVVWYRKDRQDLFRCVIKLINALCFNNFELYHLVNIEHVF